MNNNKNIDKNAVYALTFKITKACEGITFN